MAENIFKIVFTPLAKDGNEPVPVMDIVVSGNDEEAKPLSEQISDERATFSQSVNVMWQGMLGIFIVAVIIIAAASLLNAITKPKNDQE